MKTLVGSTATNYWFPDFRIGDRVIDSHEDGRDPLSPEVYYWIL